MSIRIRYTCPHCNRRIVHHPELAGHLVICSACKGEFYEPTDPLPGKPAEQALQARPETPRRLRVPEGSNPKHDLAVLSRRDASDLRTITEIVEAVLLDDPLPLPGPAGANDEPPSGGETIQDFGYVALREGAQPRTTPAIPSWEPPSKPRAFTPPAQVKPAIPAPSQPASARSQSAAAAPVPPATSLAGPAVRPLVPPSSAIPTSVVATPQLSRSIPKPAVPVSSSHKPVPAAGLAGVSIKQMVEELRRRGLGVAVVTCDMAPMRNFELACSDNMTREDALALVRKYLETLREVKPAEQSGLLKRMWKKSETE